MNVIRGNRHNAIKKNDDGKSDIRANTSFFSVGGAIPKKLKITPDYPSFDAPLFSWRGPKRRFPGDTDPANLNRNENLGNQRTPLNRHTSSSSRGGISGSGSRVTPYSATSTSTVPDSYVIVAVSEGRGAARGEVGVAAVDIRRPALALAQLSDTHSYLHTITKINYFDPVEIIVPHTFRDRKSECGGLYALLRDTFPQVKLSAVLRRHFSDSAGLGALRRVTAHEYAACLLSLSHKFYALTAAAALLKYIECIRSVIFAPESLKIEFHRSDNSAYIDVDTALRLELVESVENSGGCSLLSILSRHTVTAGGRRTLRARILQPFSKEPAIECRLEALQELLDSPHLMPQLQSVLKRLSDVESVLWLCAVVPQEPAKSRGAGETQLNQVLILHNALNTLPALTQILNMARSGFYQKITKELEDTRLQEIVLRLARILAEGGSATSVGSGRGAAVQRCFAVRAGVNGLLDVARRTFSELIVDMQTLAAGLAEQHSLPLKLNCEARGFRLLLPGGRRKQNPILPSDFIQVRFSGSSISMTTEELLLLDQQARESLNEIQSMTNIVIFGLLTELRPYLPCLYKLCEHVAELDVLVALAQASSAGNYVRPEFSSFLQLQNSVHPLLAEVTPVPPEPNDVFASPEYNFHIITGPNMGGKSVYIKQIALLQILAQIACYVPASKAVFRIADHIFSRCGFNDSIDFNASSYVLEMKEIQYILHMLSPTSLVIVDELCRGTSSEEGTSMAWAICERLLATKAFTFFTTHFLYLTRLQDLYFNVTNLHTEAHEQNGQGLSKLTYAHKISPGVTQLEHYGLTLARNTNMPNCVIKLATELVDLITQYQKPSQQPFVVDTGNEEKLLYSLYSKLMHEVRCGHGKEGIEKIIEKYKENYEELGIYLNKLNIVSVDVTDKESTTRGLETPVQDKPNEDKIIKRKNFFTNDTTTSNAATSSASDYNCKPSTSSLNTSATKPQLMSSPPYHNSEIVNSEYRD